MPRLENQTAGLLGLCFACGFPQADFQDCGPSVLAYGETQGIADAAANSIAAEVARREAKFMPEFYSVQGAVAKALDIAMAATKPVAIADTQDNPEAEDREILPGCYAH